MTEPDWSLLELAWRPARASGALGSVPLSELCEHAAGYFPTAFRVSDEFAIDLGTGAGLPGLPLALLYPRTTWLLVDSNERRCEVAESAVRRLGLGERVNVRHSRADDLGHDNDLRASAGFVVARLFGRAAELAECAVPLLAAGGKLVVSCSTETETEWSAAPLDVLGASMADRWTTSMGSFLTVVASTETPSVYPRRTAARRRHPLF